MNAAPVVPAVGRLASWWLRAAREAAGEEPESGRVTCAFCQLDRIPPAVGP